MAVRRPSKEEFKRNISSPPRPESLQENVGIIPSAINKDSKMKIEQRTSSMQTNNWRSSAGRKRENTKSFQWVKRSSDTSHERIQVKDISVPTPVLATIPAALNSSVVVADRPVQVAPSRPPRPESASPHSWTDMPFPERTSSDFGASEIDLRTHRSIQSMSSESRGTSFDYSRPSGSLSLDVNYRLGPNLSTYGAPSHNGVGSNLDIEEIFTGPQKEQERHMRNGSISSITSGASLQHPHQYPLPPSIESSPNPNRDIGSFGSFHGSHYRESSQTSGGSGSFALDRLSSDITPGNKQLNLIPLARRTAHLAHVQGYSWRLHLLECLETLMGQFMSITEAEEIISLGNFSKRKSNSNLNRSQSQKSLINMPQGAISRQRKHSGVKETPVAAQNSTLAGQNGEKAGFFGKMRRGFKDSSNSKKDRESKTISRVSPKKGPISNPSAPSPPPAMQEIKSSPKVVFGEPLERILEYASISSFIEKQPHVLPAVVFTTVEEIYRRGQLGQQIPGLLQLAGETGRVAKLMSIFNIPPYGKGYDLSTEFIHNVTSLLKKYLTELPVPVFDRPLWRLFCASALNTSLTDRVRIACAQVILRLLPQHSFSLLVYLIAFLASAPLFPENNLTIEKVSTMFGPPLMASRATGSTAAKINNMLTQGMEITGPTDTLEAASHNIKKSQEGLLWLLKHWGYVASGLLDKEFDVDVDAVMADETPVLETGDEISNKFDEYPYREDDPFLSFNEQPEQADRVSTLVSKKSISSIPRSGTHDDLGEHEMRKPSFDSEVVPNVPFLGMKRPELRPLDKEKSTIPVGSSDLSRISPSIPDNLSVITPSVVETYESHTEYDVSTENEDAFVFSPVRATQSHDHGVTSNGSLDLSQDSKDITAEELSKVSEALRSPALGTDTNPGTVPPAPTRNISDPTVFMPGSLSGADLDRTEAEAETELETEREREPPLVEPEALFKANKIEPENSRGESTPVLESSRLELGDESPDTDSVGTSSSSAWKGFSTFLSRRKSPVQSSPRMVSEDRFSTASHLGGGTSALDQLLDLEYSMLDFPAPDDTTKTASDVFEDPKTPLATVINKNDEKDGEELTSLRARISELEILRSKDVQREESHESEMRALQMKITETDQLHVEDIRKIEELKQELEKFQDSTSTHETTSRHLESLQERYKETSREFESLKAEHNQLSQSYERLKGDFEHKLDTLEDLQTQHISLSSKLTDIKDKHSITLNSLRDLERNHAQLVKTHDSLQNTHEQTKSEINTLRADNSRTIKELEERLRNADRDKAKALEESQNEIVSLQSQINGIRKLLGGGLNI